MPDGVRDSLGPAEEGDPALVLSRVVMQGIVHAVEHGWPSTSCWSIIQVRAVVMTAIASLRGKNGSSWRGGHEMVRASRTLLDCAARRAVPRARGDMAMIFRAMTSASGVPRGQPDRGPSAKVFEGRGGPRRRPVEQRWASPACRGASTTRADVDVFGRVHQRDRHHGADVGHICAKLLIADRLADDGPRRDVRRKSSIFATSSAPPARVATQRAWPCSYHATWAWCPSGQDER